MRKFLITFILMLLVNISFAQMSQRLTPRHFPNVDKKTYCVIDSLPLERITIYSPFDYESKDVIKLGENTYLMQMPFTDKMVIATNKERTKAIVLYNSYCFGRHKEFNIKETDRRLTLWYEDDMVYCGYQYDKKYKVCKYFEDWWEEFNERFKK